MSSLPPTNEAKYIQKEKRIALLFLLPALVVYGLFVYYPVLLGMINGFTDFSVFNPDPKFVGLQNFTDLFKKPEFIPVIWRTVKFTIIVVGLQYVLGLSLALLLNRELFGLRWMKNLIMLPWVLPISATVLIFNWIVHADYGLLNIFLRDIGQPQWVRFWFGDEKLAFVGVIFLHVWRNVPFYALVLLAALKNIPKTYYEAAILDGASSLDIFRKITMPMLFYQSIVVIVLHVIFTINNVDIIFLATGGGPVGVTEIMSTRAYNLMWGEYQFGMGTALSILLFIILAIMTIVSLRLRTDID
ncbi:MAG: carbohydrate ABC transporter permease [Brevinema sp.]